MGHISSLPPVPDQKGRSPSSSHPGLASRSRIISRQEVEFPSFLDSPLDRHLVFEEPKWKEKFEQVSSFKVFHP